MNKHGQNEGFHMLSDFVCEAIRDPAVPQAPPNRRGANEGILITEELSLDGTHVGAAIFDTPPAVRILPMDSHLEFNGRSVEEVQQMFFLNELLRSERPPGKYRYRESGLSASPGTVVLFQYQGQIIASATLIQVERFKSAENGTYRGALHFDVKSIRIFDPVGPDVVGAIWPKFKGYSHVKWSLDPEHYVAFEQKLTGVETPHSLE